MPRYKENAGTTASEIALIEKIGDLVELLSAAKIAAAIDQSDSVAKAYSAIQEIHNEITKIVSGESFGY